MCIHLFNLINLKCEITFIFFLFNVYLFLINFFLYNEKCILRRNIILHYSMYVVVINEKHYKAIHYSTFENCLLSSFEDIK